jgi:hypothetical protein
VFTEAHVLIPAEAREAMLANGNNYMMSGHDPVPVVKLFTPDADCTWLLTELDPEDEDRAFGLCDLGMGFPELGWVYLPELAAVRGPLGLHVERDLYFRTEHTISKWASAARTKQRITKPES